MIEIFMLTTPEKRYQKFTLFKPLKADPTSLTANFIEETRHPAMGLKSLKQL